MNYNYYPLVFKQTVIRSYYDNNCKNIKNILCIYKISKSSLYNWISLHKTNKLTYKKIYTKKSKILPEIKCYIRSYVLRKKRFIYKKLITMIKKRYNVPISKTSLYNVLKKLNITRKRFRCKFIYKRKNIHNEEIKKFKHLIKNININKIISIDETHIDTHITSIYGWNVKGKKIYTKKYIRYKKRFTIIMAINNNKVVHYKIIENSANSEDFKNFLLEMNKKYNLKNQNLLMDNARIHHAKIIKLLISEMNSIPLFNVPYCPEYNPIEMAFSKIKLQIRQKNNNHILKNLLKNIKDSISNITKNDLQNYFKKSRNLLKV